MQDVFPEEQVEVEEMWRRQARKAREKEARQKEGDGQDEHEEEEVRTEDEEKFYETKDMKKARKGPRKVKGQNMYSAQLHIFHSFPEHAQRFAPLKEVREFDYLGLRLDPFLTMNSALLLVLEKVNKRHALVVAFSYSLRYD